MPTRQELETILDQHEKKRIHAADYLRTQNQMYQGITLKEATIQFNKDFYTIPGRNNIMNAYLNQYDVWSEHEPCEPFQWNSFWGKLAIIGLVGLATNAYPLPTNVKQAGKDIGHVFLGTATLGAIATNRKKYL